MSIVPQPVKAQHVNKLVLVTIRPGVRYRAHLWKTSQHNGVDFAHVRFGNGRLFVTNLANITDVTTAAVL